MAVTVIMPRQGQSVETCILGQWYKEVDDEVRAGELLFSYETDKATFDEEAKADGILLACYFNAGDEVPVLAAIASIGRKGEVVVAPAMEDVSGKPDLPEETPKVIEFTMEPGSSLPGRIHISPLARNMAAKLGVNMEALQGSGPQGRIIARDVEAAAGKQKSIPSAPVAETGPEKKIVTYAPSVQGAGYEVKPLSNIRKLIAKAMHNSLQNSAQLTHHLSADARKILALRKKFKNDFESGAISENITINDLVCYAVVRALKKFPSVNSHFLGDQMKIFSKVHLGVAVDTERGLMVPTLRDADDYSIQGLSLRLRQLTSDCRKGSVNPDLLNPESASFTVSNLGNYGVEIFTPVINLPQAAILGVCTIFHRPVDIGDGVFAIVPMIGLSLTYDHRAVDGGEATRFLAAIRDQIQNLEIV